MEKSRAIELLEHLAWDRDIDRNPYGDALNMAIEALKAQLSQEGTTKDAISRQRALDIFDDYNVSVEYGELEAYSRDRKRLCDLPPIQPEPKEGEWVQIQRCTGDAQPDLECPFCKHRIGWFDMGRYCAGCGAKLKGGAG